jgi:quercetin dioxygenase-like cupin family protein
MTRPTGPLQPGGGWHLTHVRGRQTNERFALTEVVAPPGDMPPLHVHRRDDETLYVLEGGLTVWVGDDVLEVAPGACVHLPRNVAHTYRTSSGGDSRWLVVSSPAGFEAVIEQMAQRTMGQLFVDHGIEVLGPPGTTPEGPAPRPA